MKRLSAALPLLVCVAAFVAFLPALHAGFVDWDDDRNLLENTGYRGLGWAQLRWMLTATWMGHYIPLTWVTLGLNYVLGGMNPRGYHLGNLLLHAANAAVFYFVARRLLTAGLVGDAGPTRGPRTPPMAAAPGDFGVALGAAAAAAVFAIHPLRAESVAWVTERRDVLCGLFYLLSVLTYVEAVASPGQVRGRLKVASVALFGLALLSKAMAMTLPLTLLVLDAYPLRRLALGWRALLAEKLPYAILAVAGAVTAVVAVTRGAAWTSYASYGIGARLAMTAYSLWFYPSRMLWPMRLSPLYELPSRVDPAGWRFLGPALGLIAVSAALLALRRCFPGGLVAWLHSAIVLAPVSGVAHAGYQLAHDRYSYLSGLGFAVVAGAGVTWLLRARQRGQASRWVLGVALSAVALSLLGLGAGAWEQSQIWHDSETLWRAAVEAEPDCGVCQDKLGTALLARRDFGAAEACFRRAVALHPERGLSHNNLGTALAEQERYGEAEIEFSEALRLAPHLAGAAANLGAIYARQGKNAEAVPLLRRALALAPDLARARVSLAHALGNGGIRLAREGKLVEATAAFGEAAELMSDDADIERNLGQALVEQGKGAAAIAPLERAVALRPGGAAERFWLARAYQVAGRRVEAERQIAALRELDPAAAARLAPGRR